MTRSRPDHRALAGALRYRVLEGRGMSDPATRKAAADRAAGGPAMSVPYDDLANQIGECSHRVTDAQVEVLFRQRGVRRPLSRLSRLPR